MCVAMFYRLLTIFIAIIENKEPEINDFGVIFGGMKFIQIANNFQISNIYIVYIMFELVRFHCLHYFALQASKGTKIFQIFYRNRQKP